ncbi:hypothetical protein SSX86_003840 [Deinandra increscens subsp. villosa]|uniref:Uncharacterized protein n=1 Tax=Deinandra increscens subsp. villosa TaxID=3103831 RepID=A0AAP0DJ40_9ASTR
MNSTLLKASPFIHCHPYRHSRTSNHFTPFRFHRNMNSSSKQKLQISRTSNAFKPRVYPKNSISNEPNCNKSAIDSSKKVDFDKFGGLIRCGFVVGLVVLGVVRCQRALAVDTGSDLGVFAQKGVVYMKDFWNGPKLPQILRVFREQGLILAVLLGLSAFFSMAETSITTLSPWKVRELAEKEGENGVFKLLRTDITRFLTTILIGTTVVNIGATALFTEAATTVFGEAGVSAATGVMTVVVLLLTEITPKSIAVHNATAVARAVVRPVAWLSVVLYPVGRVVTFLSMGMLKILGLKAKSEPSVTEDELKLMLRVAELSGAIEEEEQDMIENVLEIKDTHVKEVMTPLVDVVAVSSGATLVDFHHLWVTHQYSRLDFENLVKINNADCGFTHNIINCTHRVPVFEQRIDNIVGVVYAMDLLDLIQKGDMLETALVGEIAHKPAYFVPDSMLVWNLLREFRIRKVHMAVVLNEYGGTVGIVTLEDLVEEIVGEIFDENDSKEEIERKTGNIVKRAEGVFDGHQYETVSGFICEAFGYIPRTGESIKVVLKKANEEDNDDENKQETDGQDQKDRSQTFKLGILAGNCRKVNTVRFERINNNSAKEIKEAARLVPRFWKKKWINDESSGGGVDILLEDSKQ